MGTELSETVQKAVPKVASKVLEILAGWGIQPQERENGSTDVWWSRPSD